MIPLTLRVTNFRSFRGTQHFNFPTQPGLYFLQGINEVEPRLEGNGSGKSTLWQALTWCIWGKTSKGLKAGDVCNWDAGKGAEVEFDFMLGGDHDYNGALACVWTIRRTWSPNSWTLSHVAEFVTDEEVVDLAKEKDNPFLAMLCLDFEGWLNSVFMAQGEPMFLDMKREQQASLFSTVMDADRWLDYSARASKRAGDEDSKVREMERELSGLRGALEATGRQDYREESKLWESKHDEKLLALESEHDSLLAKRKGYKKALEQAQERETNARAWVAKDQPDAGLEKDYWRASAAVSDYKMLREMREADTKRLMADVEKYLDAKGTCPACGQRVSQDHIQKEVKELERKAKKCLEEMQQFVRESEAAVKRRDELGVEHSAAIEELDKARSELDDAQREVGGSRRALELADRDLDRMEEDHERLRAERNPYADMEERKAEEARRLHREIERLQERMDASSERQSLFQMWVRGFKDVRLMKIDEALTELEIEANSCVDALGLLGWELQFQVDRETKGGKIERGFNCYVRSPANDRQVPWEVWSGGESQRLRIAGTMGLADLIRARTGAAIALEIWDEPTDGLSPQGAADLLECLRERARREKRQIWVVDHRTHDFGGFSGVTVVRKTARGSIIEGGISKP